MADSFYEEARAAMHRGLLGLLELSKIRTIRSVMERDPLDFELEWNPGSEHNDLTDAQARAIWQKYGFEQGARISLRPSPYDSTDAWVLHCSMSERRVWGTDLAEIMYPGGDERA